MMNRIVSALDDLLGGAAGHTPVYRLGKWTNVRDDPFDARAMGVTFDGVTDDEPLLQDAIDIVSSAGSGGLKLPAQSTALVNNRIEIPTNVRVIGAGGRSSKIKAGASFPTSTAVVRIGNTTDYTFSAALEQVFVECSHIAGSIGVECIGLQEQSGLKDVLVNSYMGTGVLFSGAGLGNSNYLAHDLEVYASASATVGVGIDVVGGAWKNDFRNITVFGGGATVQLVGIRVTDGKFYGSNIHIENYIDGLLIAGTSSQVAVFGIDGGQPGTNVIRIPSGQLGRISISHALKAGYTNLIKNDNFSKTYVDGAMAFYAQDGGADPYEFGTSVAVTSNFGPLSVNRGTAIDSHLCVTTAYDFGTVNAGIVAEHDFTVTGASGSSAVTVTPSAGTPADLIWCALIKATDTVTVRLFNPTAGNIVVGSRNWTIAVTHHA